MNDQPKPTSHIESKQEWIDPDDIPELTEEFFEQAEIWRGDKLIRPGKTTPRRSQKNSI